MIKTYWSSGELTSTAGFQSMAEVLRQTHQCSGWWPDWSYYLAVDRRQTDCATWRGISWTWTWGQGWWGTATGLSFESRQIRNQRTFLHHLPEWKKMLAYGWNKITGNCVHTNNHLGGSVTLQSHHKQCSVHRVRPIDIESRIVDDEWELLIPRRSA